MIITAVTVGIAVLALIFSIYSVWFAWSNSAANLSLRKLSKLEAELTELADSTTRLHEMLGKLRSRIGMRELRARRKNGADRPEYDMTTEAGRTLARRDLEADLAKSGRLNPRTHNQG